MRMIRDHNLITPQGRAYDRERALRLKKHDLTILRFANDEIDHQFQSVCQIIDRTIQSRL